MQGTSLRDVDMKTYWATSEAEFPVSGLLGILGIAIGAAAASFMIPTNFHEPGAMRAPAVAMALGLLSAPILLTLKSARTWLRAEHIMMFGLVYWLLLEALIGSDHLGEISQAALQKIFFLLALYAACFWLGSLMTPRLMFNEKKVRDDNELTADFIFAALILCFALGMLRYMIPCQFSLECLGTALQSARFDIPWSRGASGGGHSFVRHLAFFGYLTLPLAVLLYMITHKARWRIWLGAILALVFMAFLVRDGGRRIVGMVAGVALLTWILLQPRLGLRHIVLSLVWLLVLALVMQWMISYRRAEGGVFGQLLGNTAGQVLDIEAGAIRVDQNLRNLGWLVDIVPSRHPYVHFEPLIYVAVRPIPRYFWPEKPKDRGFNLSQQLRLRTAARSHTITTTAIGDWYLMWGSFSVAIGGLLTGALAKLCSSLLLATPNTRRRVLFALMTMCLFVSLRALHEIIVMSYPALALILIIKAKRYLAGVRQQP